MRNEYAVVWDSGEGDGTIITVDMEEMWTYRNTNGWTDQELAHMYSMHSNVMGIYRTEEEAQIILNHLRDNRG